MLNIGLVHFTRSPDSSQILLMMMVVHVAFEGGEVMDPTADDGSVVVAEVLGPGGRARSFAIEQYSNGLIPRSNIDSIPRPTTIQFRYRTAAHCLLRSNNDLFLGPNNGPFFPIDQPNVLWDTLHVVISIIYNRQ